jgi:bacterioferritin
MIREDLVAERVAIDSYSEMIRFVGDTDPTTRRMLEGILAMEEEHAEDLATMLEEIGREARPIAGAVERRGRKSGKKKARR